MSYVLNLFDVMAAKYLVVSGNQNKFLFSILYPSLTNMMFYPWVVNDTFHLTTSYRDYHVISILIWNSVREKMYKRMEMKWSISFYPLYLMPYMRITVLIKAMTAL